MKGDAKKQVKLRLTEQNNITSFFSLYINVERNNSYYYKFADFRLNMVLNSLKGPTLKNFQIKKSVEKYIKMPNKTKTTNLAIRIS